MKHQHPQSITSLPPSPEAERHARMVKYTVMMSIRVACIVALLFVQGWWLLVFALGAVFLPYFAVVVANVATSRGGAAPERPGGLVPLPRADGGTDWVEADAAEPGRPEASAAPDEANGADAHDERTDDREERR
ncbi:DUF3099 domain-containing protein [Agromyces marinus]|uniref:DUF3099 domain-containing protein n=1 Tax=Agromyces marinus TaxID=1389020 RepID=A0ABM8GX56_9MICO|nr:DUF3099 domain-containing protein [Agromyces marinus]UIP58631.1 hypothetical protein DSM26151_15100 [Agromyces marinus]BDZ53085.1 hypothetical protein GCM10025870_01580 [Agromyces marinus]